MNLYYVYYIIYWIKIKNLLRTVIYQKNGNNLNKRTLKFRSDFVTQYLVDIFMPQLFKLRKFCIIIVLPVEICPALRSSKTHHCLIVNGISMYVLCEYSMTSYISFPITLRLSYWIGPVDRFSWTGSFALPPHLYSLANV